MSMSPCCGSFCGARGGGGGNPVADVLEASNYKKSNEEKYTNKIDRQLGR